MIEAKNQAELFEGYLSAYKVAKTNDESTWHPAWKLYHEMVTRRHDGRPLIPMSNGLSTAEAGAANHYMLSDDQQLAVNHIQSILRTIMAVTFNRDPEFSLEALFPGFEAPGRAGLAGCALTNTWRAEHLSEPLKEACFDSLQYGRGWCRLGWQSSFTRQVAGDTPRDLTQDAIQAINEISRRGARLASKSFTLEEMQSHLDRFDGKLLIEDKPTIRRVSPFDMFFDPLATNISDARWIANRWRCPLAWARTNTDWSKSRREALDVTGLGSTSLDPQENLGTTVTGGGEYEGKDVVWIVDFFDLGDGTWCQFAEGGDGFLRKPSNIPFPFGHPFTYIENIDDTSSGQPISEVEIIWPHQRDLSSIAEEMGVDRKQSRGKVIVSRENAEQLKAVLESSDQGLVVVVDMPPGGENIADSYKMVQATSRAGDLNGQANVMANWMTQASGVSDFLRAGGDAGATATEVNAKQSAAANFMGEKASRFRNFIEANAQRCLTMMQVYSRLDYFVTTKAVHPETGDVTDATVNFNRSHIAGSFRVIVSADSTEEKTPQAKMARAQAIAATSMPFAQAGIVDMGQLFKYVMKEGFGITDPTPLLKQEAYIPQPQPPAADGSQPQQSGPPPIGGISMTPGTQAGQLGATAAADRLANGDSVPQPAQGQ